MKFANSYCFDVVTLHPVVPMCNLHASLVLICILLIILNVAKWNKWAESSI